MHKMKTSGTQTIVSSTKTKATNPHLYFTDVDLCNFSSFLFYKENRLKVSCVWVHASSAPNKSKF
jgi:hypothetical protein